MNVRLTPAEKDMLLEVQKRYDWCGNLDIRENEKGIAVLNIDENDAIDLRELCSDYLNEVGFDQKYEPNKKGGILETLVDSLFVP